jgi:hypothetical protein
MLKLLIPCIIVCCLIVFPITNAGAVGLGFYVERGSGSSDWEEEDDYDNTNDFDTDDKRAGFGFVLDTNVAQDRLFNYRLQIGYEKRDTEIKNSIDSADLKGFVMSHDFGFGVLRTRNVRLWLGPELRLAYYTGSPKINDDLDISIFEYGIGPVVGANFNIGSTVTLAVKTGYLFQGFVGIGEDDFDDEYTYTGTSRNFYVNFAIIFRIGDVF